MLHEIGGLVLDSGLGSAIGDGCESEAFLVEVARLFGVSNIYFHIVNSFNWKRICFHRKPL